MLKLYGGAQSRAAIVRWYLEELQTPYDFVVLDMKSGEHLQPDFLDINPMGKVPAIQDGNLKLWESGAILLYLADKHDQLPVDIQKRAEIYQWVMFANSTLGQGIFSETTREKETPRLLTPLDQIFQHRTFLLGEEFSVADVALGAVLAYIPMMLNLDLSPYGAVVNYIQRLSERPAFQKGILGKSSNTST
jgi:glutathione S-transferase